MQRRPLEDFLEPDERANFEWAEKARKPPVTEAHAEAQEIWKRLRDRARKRREKAEKAPTCDVCNVPYGQGWCQQCCAEV